MARPRLAVIGASHFQLPLIERAQEMGCEVHAFAWECGDVGEAAADAFHPVSIVETERIADICAAERVDGICTIASDLATVAVSEVAERLGLVANSVACMRVATNKRLMRQAFVRGGDPTPASVALRLGDGGACEVEGPDGTRVTLDAGIRGFDPRDHGIAYPLIVKPSDRSGSRGVTKLEPGAAQAELADALERALGESFAREAVVEEFVEGDEFSVEGISWQGVHRILAVTRKATSGAPHFIESGHLEPSLLPREVEERAREVALHALDTLGVSQGASHTELKVDADGRVRLIEVGARMGGDCIGSHLVRLSTGIDYVGAVVSIALGREPDLGAAGPTERFAGVRFCFSDEELKKLRELCRAHPEAVRYAQGLDGPRHAAGEVSDSSTRLGHVVVASSDPSVMHAFLPPSLASVAGGAW